MEFSQGIIGCAKPKADNKPICSADFYMDIEHFQPWLENLANQYAEKLVVCSCRRGSLHLSWKVSHKETGGCASIEAYQQKDGNTWVDFHDGYDPEAPSSEPMPIGGEFEAFITCLIERTSSLNKKEPKFW